MSGKANGRLVFVRCVLWFGIILDFVNVIQYCFPEFMLKALGIAGSVEPTTRSIRMHAAALMFAWTLLLVWTDRKPIERRMVMLLTIPIALGIAGSFCYLIAAKALPATSAFIIVAPVITAFLFLAGYLAACRIAASESGQKQLQSIPKGIRKHA
jgi:hypothetical protein